METYQIKETKLSTRTVRMLPHYCLGLREFAEKVIEWHADLNRYQLVNWRLYDACDVEWEYGEDGPDGDLIPIIKGSPVIDPDNPQASYCMDWEGYTYTAVEVEL